MVFVELAKISFPIDMVGLLLCFILHPTLSIVAIVLQALEC